MKFTGIENLKLNIRKSKSLRGIRAIINAAQKRLDDVQFIGWPLLEYSFQKELDELLAIAKEKGFDVESWEKDNTFKHTSVGKS